MIEANKMKTEETKAIEEALKPSFPSTEAYRYNSASIRVRIIDQKFDGKSMEEREDDVLPLIRNLPEETQADITLLLLLTPEEASSNELNRYSLLNKEFDEPVPSEL